ncbi:sulfite exporter TauE/SafE family protein [Thermosediminibacter litoriperuensis]|uniref:Probable membrane transporter protein n=1 Tax=Thermosediminibacter litoriperuensis TaxID=291989 RepID=A0A5S5AXU6_9FIRM|nr:sulfite exporter TauE/SafE family protein [Thermosediminibacter litoriperuensis]TYP57782.1 putative membrane protein YfcA [Thermosediminibacter litoriperuensis]
MTQAVLSVLGLLTLGFSYVFFKDTVKNKHTFSDASWAKLSVVGFIVNFFDTLGIGSFAPTTAFFKLMKLVPDKLIPGTLNVSMTIPVVLEALIFITVIKVEPITLISMLASATLGAVVGAGIVSKLPERKIQIGMGIALLVVAMVFLAGMFNLMPVGGEAIGLTGTKLIIGVAGNFILGALMTIGIGLYAPCMALVYALGMSPRVAFPIMMGSCAFLMPAASIKFVQEGAYDRKASVAITIAGSLGVLVAAYIVKSLPLTMLKWLVVFVIIYTAVTMLRSAFKNQGNE